MSVRVLEVGATTVVPVSPGRVRILEVTAAAPATLPGRVRVLEVSAGIPVVPAGLHAWTGTAWRKTKLYAYTGVGPGDGTAPAGWQPVDV